MYTNVLTYTNGVYDIYTFDMYDMTKVQSCLLCYHIHVLSYIDRV